MNLDALSLNTLPQPPAGVLRAQKFFFEEIELRSGIQMSSCCGTGMLVLDTMERIARYEPRWMQMLAALGTPGKEGYSIYVDRTNNVLVIAGADERGCLYGAGKVLRKCRLRNGSAVILDELVSQCRTPGYAMRGHQYGYRDKQNTCPCWTDEDFERYIRDMILFGSNAVELIPPVSDDALFSPAFQQDPLTTLTHWSAIAHSYGLDVSLWYPNADDDYSLPEIRSREMQNRQEVFSQTPYIDSILIPTGDPGNLEPHLFFEVAAECAEILHRYHPQAKVFLSPQGLRLFDGEYEAFYEEVAKQPSWLYGLCYAPWNSDTIEQMHNRLPEKYKNRIRYYPDITHNTSCQYEVPEWDMAFALSEGREGYTSRPKAMKLIHDRYAPYTIGSLTYSEGIHDDVNKVVWGDQDFDPTISPEETLRDYVRIFIDSDLADELSGMLMSLEDSWVGDIEQNEGIDVLYTHFVELEQRVSDSVRANYRFKMALLRAMSDYQTKYRAKYDRSLQREAEAILAKAPEIGADQAVFQARNVLNRSYTEPVCYELTQKMFGMAAELFYTPGCHIKLSSKFFLAQSWVRGAWLDCARLPLNDYQWYTVQFKKIQALCDEKEKLIQIAELLHRTDPGKGGQYLCLADPKTFQKHVVRSVPYEEDPGAVHSPAITYDIFNLLSWVRRARGWYDECPVPLNWIRKVRVENGDPLVVKIEDLDPNANYKLRVVYSDLLRSDARTAPVEALGTTLQAGDIVVHCWVRINGGLDHSPVYQYLLPKASYRSGSVTLSWRSTNSWCSLGLNELWIERTEEEFV